MDGDTHTALVASQVDYLSIIYPINPSDDCCRNRQCSWCPYTQLTPTHSIIDTNGKIDTSAGLSLQTSGGGEKFLQFIKDELMPYIEKKYKPAPYKIFSGHSFGGLMTFYCLTKHPDMFNAYISVSPALWWDNKIHLKVATKNLRNTDYRNKLFFFQRCR